MKGIWAWRGKIGRKTKGFRDSGNMWTFMEDLLHFHSVFCRKSQLNGQHRPSDQGVILGKASLRQVKRIAKGQLSMKHPAMYLGKHKGNLGLSRKWLAMGCLHLSNNHPAWETRGSENWQGESCHREQSLPIDSRLLLSCLQLCFQFSVSPLLYALSYHEWCTRPEEGE